MRASETGEATARHDGTSEESRNGSQGRQGSRNARSQEVRICRHCSVLLLTDLPLQISARGGTDQGGRSTAQPGQTRTAGAADWSVTVCFVGALSMNCFSQADSSRTAPHCGGRAAGRHSWRRCAARQCGSDEPARSALSIIYFHIQCSLVLLGGVMLFCGCSSQIRYVYVPS